MQGKQKCNSECLRFPSALLPCVGGDGPTVTEINISWLPIDQYASNSPQNTTIPSCPSDYTVRQCLAYLFGNNPKSSTVYLFVDSDLQVSTGAGQSVPVRTPSGVAVVGGQPAMTVNLVVQP